MLAQLLVSGLVLGSLYALMGVSMSLIYSTTGVFHVAHAVVYAAAAYAAAWATTVGIPLLGAILFGLVVAVGLGVLMDRPGYQYLRKRNSSPMVVFLFSLGLSIIAPNVLQLIFGPNSYALTGFTKSTIFAGNVRFTTLDIIVVVVSWICIALTVLGLRYTKYGRAITAVRTNEDTAVAVGVRVGQVYILVFAAGSALAALAAILYTMGAVAQPTMGMGPVLLAFVAMFVGGVGNTVGAATGGLLLGLITDVSALWMASKYASAAAFIVLFVVLIVRPRGLFARRAA